jgi:hypothetical protein
MIEQWKPCPGFEGWYQVSDLGRVRRVTRGKGTYFGRIRNARPTSKGYLLVNLYKAGKQYARTVHRLVALAFIPNPLSLPEVHHVDEIKAHNWADNLEWLSKPEHAKKTFQSGLKPSGETHGQAKLTWEQVTKIRSRYLPGLNSRQRGNGALLAKEFGVSQTAVLLIVNGKTWKSLPPKKPSVGVIPTSGSHLQESELK